MKAIVFLPAILLTISSFGQSTIDVVNPPSVSTPHGYSQVSKLFRDDILIEIEATAIVPIKNIPGK
jgi:hypothetical protein